MLAPNKCWLRQGYWKSNCLCPKAPSCSPEDFLCSKKSSGCCSCSRPKSCRSCSVMLGQGKDLIQHSEDGCSLVWEHRKATLDLDGQMTIIRGSWLLVGVLCLSLPCKSKKQRNKSWSFLFFFLPFFLTFLILFFLLSLLCSEVLTLGTVSYIKHVIIWSALIFPKTTAQTASPQPPGHFTPSVISMQTLTPFIILDCS